MQRNHPEVEEPIYGLGSVPQAMGDLAGARAHFERALRIYRRFLGEDHPNTVTVRDNLAALDKLAQA